MNVFRMCVERSFGKLINNTFSEFSYSLPASDKYLAKNIPKMNEKPKTATGITTAKEKKNFFFVKSLRRINRLCSELLFSTNKATTNRKIKLKQKQKG